MSERLNYLTFKTETLVSILMYLYEKRRLHDEDMKQVTDYSRLLEKIFLLEQEMQNRVDYAFKPS